MCYIVIKKNTNKIKVYIKIFTLAKYKTGTCRRPCGLITNQVSYTMLRDSISEILHFKNELFRFLNLIIVFLQAF